MRTYNLFFLLLIVSSTFGQFDLAPYADGVSNPSTHVENNSGNITYSSQVVNQGPIHSLSINDTAYFICNVSSLVPESGNNTNVDTLNVSIRVLSYNGTDGAYTIYNRYESHSRSGLSDVTNVANSFTFVEGQVDTVKLVVTNGTFVLDKYIVDINSINVISDVSNELSATNAIINNPVTNGELEINLGGRNADLELVSYDGQVVKSFTIQGHDKISVADLNNGMYLLRGVNSPSYRKIIIK